MRLLRSAVILVGLLLSCGLAVIYLSNLRQLHRTYPLAPITLAADVAPDAPERGKRLADVTGCTDCHGADLRGKTFIDEGWWRGRYYSSNLTLKAQEYSDQELARIVREGVRPDGLGVIAMPAFGFSRLTDAEMAAIIAFIRSVPRGGSVQPGHHIGPLDHWDLWIGKLKPAISYVASERMKAPADLGPAHEYGRHLVSIVCTECHGGDLTGNGWDSGAPDLAVVAAYSRELLVGLLSTGIGADGRQHGLMSQVSRDRLHHLTDRDISAIHDYLLERARRPRKPD